MRRSPRQESAGADRQGKRGQRTPADAGPQDRRYRRGPKARSVIAEAAHRTHRRPLPSWPPSPAHRSPAGYSMRMFSRMLENRNTLLRQHKHHGVAARSVGSRTSMPSMRIAPRTRVVESRHEFGNRRRLHLSDPPGPPSCPVRWLVLCRRGVHSCSCRPHYPTPPGRRVPSLQAKKPQDRSSRTGERDSRSATRAFQEEGRQLLQCRHRGLEHVVKLRKLHDRSQTRAGANHQRQQGTDLHIAAEHCVTAQHQGRRDKTHHPEDQHGE